MSSVLYYSNYCSHSKSILAKLSRSSIKSEIHFLCIDKRVSENGKLYIILEDGSKILLPNGITKVPALLLLYKNNEILFGKDVHDFFDLKLKNVEEIKRVDPRTDKIEPESFSLNDISGSVHSDNFSFVDMSINDLSAKGNGGMRMMYNYSGLNDSDKIHTPEEDYKPNKVDDSQIKKYQEERAAAIN